MPESSTVEDLLHQIRAGNQQAIGALFELHRERLWRMLQVRWDSRLSTRASPDDVLQEAFLDVARRIDEYLTQTEVPFYIWLRFLTIQRFQMIQRMHLGAKMRTVGQEASLGSDSDSAASSDSMAGRLAGDLTSPSKAAIRNEVREALRAALESMDPLDREVLALRHFEELGNAETAKILGIHKDAASKRYVRALRRLQQILGDSGASLSH